MGALHLTPAAEHDLEHIWQTGALNWGAAQAEKYVNALFAGFDLLIEFPDMARMRSELAPPVRLHPHKSHVIVYNSREGGIDVIRILHKRQSISKILVA